MTTLRLIGDVHQEYGEFLRLCDGPDHVIQVGDLGFQYAAVKGLDPEKVRVLAGNHDNYDRDSPDYFRKQPFFLGDWGVHAVPEIGDVFYTRGAWSIDGEDRRRRMRRGGKPTWWEEEELPYHQLEQAVLEYTDRKPDIVVTHECPLSVVPKVTDPVVARNFGYDGVILTRTNQSLQVMLEVHRPKLWVFGHYHRRWHENVGGTNFVCLDMIRSDADPKNSYMDVSHGFLEIP